MRTRNLGRSGTLVGEIGLGTWSLAGDGYGPVPEDQARRTIAAALDAGCNFIETADCYGEGRVESLIGEAIKTRGRDKVVVSTRIGVDRGPEVTRKRFSARYLTDACERSLKRLGTDYVDALVLHNPSLVTLTEGAAWKALEDLRAAGKARMIGVSVNSYDVGSSAIQAGAELVVVPYNLLFPKLLHRLSADLSGGMVAVVVRSPLAYGLLADTWGASRRFGENDHRIDRWSTADLNRRVRQRESLKPLVHGEIASLREAALRYVLSNGLVSVVTPGARTPEHATQNARAAETLPYLPDDDLQGIGGLLSSVGING